MNFSYTKKGDYLLPQSIELCQHSEEYKNVLLLYVLYNFFLF